MSAVFLFAGFFLLCSSLSMAKDTFMISEDSSILAGDHQFANMEEYLRSHYFREQGKRCGTRKLDVPVDHQTVRALNDCTLGMTRIQSKYWLSSEPVTLPVWFHVMSRSDGVGNISEADIIAQINVLNEDYRAKVGSLGSKGYDTRIQFTLAGITRTQNDWWFNDGDSAGYTNALNRNPAKNVNVYTNSASGYLGYAIFPQDGAGQENDGIVMNFSTIGGRKNGYPIYDQGRTLVHEMGHYLGLLHTFEGYSACNNSYSSGDLIVDTPAEVEEHYECVQTSSCGSQDPIHNYMNYTPDSCMTGFTREQANRLVCSLMNYRSGLISQTRIITKNPGGAVIAPSALTPLLLGPIKSSE